MRVRGDWPLAARPELAASRLTRRYTRMLGRVPERTLGYMRLGLERFPLGHRSARLRLHRSVLGSRAPHLAASYSRSDSAALRHTGIADVVSDLLNVGGQLHALVMPQARPARITERLMGNAVSGVNNISQDLKVTGC